MVRVSEYAGVCGREQAILPLRGKILNIERKDDAAIYKNQEIQNLILALGLGVKVHISGPLLAIKSI